MKCSTLSSVRRKLRHIFWISLLNPYSAIYSRAFAYLWVHREIWRGWRNEWKWWRDAFFSSPLSCVPQLLPRAFAHPTSSCSSANRLSSAGSCCFDVSALRHHQEPANRSPGTRGCRSWSSMPQNRRSAAWTRSWKRNAVCSEVKFVFVITWLVCYCKFVIYSLSCQGEETMAKGCFFESSCHLPTAHHLLDTVKASYCPFNVERLAGKLWIPIFIVCGVYVQKHIL